MLKSKVIYLLNTFRKNTVNKMNGVKRLHYKFNVKPTHYPNPRKLKGGKKFE